MRRSDPLCPLNSWPLPLPFEQAGIDAVVLKGLALIARFYRDPGLRPMADVDVLVPPSDVERASELAMSLGWHPRHRPTPAFLRVKHAGPSIIRREAPSGADLW